MTDPKDVPNLDATAALGFSMQVDLGAGRTCTLQTYLANDCSLHALNMMLDKMTAAGDRQRAHYQIEGLERDFVKLEKEQAQGLADLNKIQADFDVEQKQRAAEIENAGKVLANYQSAHASAAGERGVRDASRMKSTDKVNATKVEARIKDLRAEMQVAPEVLAATVRQAQIVLDQRAALIARTCADIERNRGIVAAGLKA